MNVQEIFQSGDTEWLLHSGHSKKKKVGGLCVFKLILIHKSLELNITLKKLYSLFSPVIAIYIQYRCSEWFFLSLYGCITSRAIDSKRVCNALCSCDTADRQGLGQWVVKVSCLLWRPGRTCSLTHEWNAVALSNSKDPWVQLNENAPLYSCFPFPPCKSQVPGCFF